MSARLRRAARATALLLCSLGLLASAGCKSFLEPVSPWERETLSRPDMAWESDRLLGAIRSHVFFSKEAARGGAGGAGGGCGCN
jgi:hypothetical protein